MSKLEECSPLELLIELMYDGESGLVHELKAIEPILNSEITAALRSKLGCDYGDEFDLWYEWYISVDSPASNEEKDILENLYTFKNKFDHLAGIIKRRNED